MHGSRYRFILLPAAFALAAIAVVALSNHEALAPLATRPRDPSTAVQNVRPTPDFTLPSFDRRLLALSDFKGKIVVLNFWASWCTPCKQEMPNLERAWQDYKHRGVVVLGINVADDMENAAEFVRALRITYPNVYDRDRSRLDAYQVIALPTTVFMDRLQHIRGRFVGGYLDEAGYQELRAKVLALLDSSP